MSSSRQALRLRPLQLAIAALLAASTGLAHADALQDLTIKVEALQKEIDNLKKQQTVAATANAAPANAVAGGATKGSFKLPGSDTSVTLGGYVKLDGIYNSRSAGANSGADQSFDPTSIAVGPTAGDNERRQLTLHARQSRFFVRTATPTTYGDVNTHVEFDLFGNSGNESVSNSHNLRLRHAYGTIGGLLAGQTWSNFMMVSAGPQTLDFGGPVGQTFIRQSQLRWTQPFSGGQWSVALENPESGVTLANGTGFRADDDRLPDLTANVGFKTSYGEFALAGVVRQIRTDSATPATRDSRTGGGIAAYGVIPVVGSDTVSFTVAGGNGIGRYWGGIVTDGFVDAAGRLDLPQQVGGFVSYRHFWTPQLRSTAALGALRVSNPGFAATTQTRRMQSAHLNLIWSPVPNTNVGIEYIYGRREVESGSTGRLSRLQASVQTSF